MPADYREFLIEYNGATPKRELFTIPALGQDALLSRFFGLAAGDEYGLEQWNERFQGEMPSGVVLVGIDQGGGFVILGGGDAELVGVYYWDHGLAFPQSDEESNTYPLAPSFDAFWSMLREP